MTDQKMICAIRSRCTGTQLQVMERTMFAGNCPVHVCITSPWYSSSEVGHYFDPAVDERKAARAAASEARAEERRIIAEQKAADRARQVAEETAANKALRDKVSQERKASLDAAKEKRREDARIKAEKARMAADREYYGRLEAARKAREEKRLAKKAFVRASVPEGYFNASTVSKKTGISANTLCRYCKLGEVPSVRIGHEIFLSPADAVVTYKRMKLLQGWKKKVQA